MKKDKLKISIDLVVDGKSVHELELIGFHRKGQLQALSVSGDCLSPRESSASIFLLGLCNSLIELAEKGIKSEPPTQIQ